MGIVNTFMQIQLLHINELNKVMLLLHPTADSLRQSNEKHEKETIVNL